MLVALTFYRSNKWIFLQESLIILFLYIYMYKNIGFPAQAEYPYFPVAFRLRISLNILKLFLIINDSLLHFRFCIGPVSITTGSLPLSEGNIFYS